MQAIPGLRIYGPLEDKAALVSFAIEGIHPDCYPHLYSKIFVHYSKLTPFKGSKYMTNDCYGVLNEFKDINFRDKRLNERFTEIMQTLDSKPSGLITKAFIDAKDQKAAYRFLDNKKAAFETMLQSHQQRVSERCRNHKLILAVQDSTSVYLPGARKVSDMSSIGDLNEKYPGFNIHTTLLITPDREILGIADLHAYERKHTKKSKTQDKLHATHKESGKWLNAIKNTRTQINSDAALVWIADREGDFWDYFIQLSETGERFIQRVCHKRYMQGADQDYFEYLKSQSVMGVYTFEVQSKGGEDERAGRIVKCEVRSVEITLKKPKELPREMKTLCVRAIHVIEQDSVTPLEWFLITNIECTTFDEILEKIRWYQQRWAIEELHKVVKSGCGVEEMRLEGRERLMKYLLLLFIVGMRILWMSKLAKQTKELPCTQAFTEEEWQFLYIRKHKKKPQEGTMPTIKESIRWLAALGGFNEYNKKREPGVMTLWRGMRCLKE